MEHRSIERYLWALVLIVVGGLMLAGNLDLIDYNIGSIIIRLWPLFLIIPGISSLSKGKYFWGSALIVGGLSFLLANFTDIDIWQYIWPLIIIAFGFTLLFRSNSWTKKDGAPSSEDYIDETIIFGGIEKRIKSKKFSGGKVDCIFGGAELDLSEVELAKDKVVLEINAVFGGSDIRVNPKNYKVLSKGTGVFGAWVNKSESSKKDKPVLEITGAAVFGGTEIKS